MNERNFIPVLKSKNINKTTCTCGAAAGERPITAALPLLALIGKV